MDKLIVRNDDFCYMDTGTFPYCSCKCTTKDIVKHEKFNSEGCYYIDKIFSSFNVKHLAAYLKEYEIYDIGFGWRELSHWGFKNAEEVHEHFSIVTPTGKKLDLMIPKFICKKVDDEFDHQIKMKLSKFLYTGYDEKHNPEFGKAMQAWAVLNTNSKNIKIIGQIVTWNKL